MRLFNVYRWDGRARAWTPHEQVTAGSVADARNSFSRRAGASYMLVESCFPLYVRAEPVEPVETTLVPFIPSGF
jgi:hypothetical protein